jgi:hypothetical protein
MVKWLDQEGKVKENRRTKKFDRLFETVSLKSWKSPGKK